MSETEKLLTDAYYWLSMYKAGAMPEDLALEQVKGVLIEQPTLNENQQIVLAWLKHDYKEFDNQSPIEVPTSLFESFECGYLSDEEQLAFESLTEKQEAETIRAFMDWVIESEE